MKIPATDRLSVPVSKRDWHRGPLNAPAQLLEYGDFECPVCGAIHPLVQAVQEAMGKDLCFAFRNFPLTNMHPHAESAAEAAEAAGAQGRYWEMNDLLFENQEALEEEYLAAYATSLGLDAPRLINEVMAGAYEGRVREDFLGGVRSGVNGTPTFFVNGWRYDGPRDLESMVAALSEPLERG
jgi:protein-disulfide isomerase